MRVLDCEGENLQHRNQFELFEINCDKTTELELTQRLWSLGTFDQLQSLLILEISNYINDVEGRYFLTKTERFPEGCRERSAVLSSSWGRAQDPFQVGLCQFLSCPSME